MGTEGEIQGFDALLVCDGAEAVINDTWRGFTSPRNVLVYLAGAAACRGDLAGARRWHDLMQSEYGTGGMGNWGNVCAVHRAVSSVLFQQPPASFGCPEGTYPLWKADQGTSLVDDPRTPDCDESVAPPVGSGGDCDGGAEGGGAEGGGAEGGGSEGGGAEGGGSEGGGSEGGGAEGGGSEGGGSEGGGSEGGGSEGGGSEGGGSEGGGSEGGGSEGDGSEGGGSEGDGSEGGATGGVDDTEGEVGEDTGTDLPPDAESSP
ncbi:hypothetical protein [Modestobacter marinus]|uniref:hypothetical protein n=1 Tax=Modestobacter marinus TaxID=477641 RepID=UPI0031F09B0B